MAFLPLISTDPTDEDLGHFLAGAADTHTRKRVEAWLAESEERWAYLDQLRNAWDAGRRPRIEGDVQRFLRAFHEAKGRDLEDEKGKEDQGVGKPNRAPLAYVAGFVILCLLVVSTLSSRWFPNIRIGNRDQPTRIYTTTNAQRTLIQLPDGSSVLLAPASRLEVVAGFERGERRVIVTGEALFTVQSRTDGPFIVHSENTVTQVLGTVFAVRKYPEDTAVRVIVTQGRVATGAVKSGVISVRERTTVSADSDVSPLYERSMIVNAGQVAYILSRSQTIVTYASSTAALLGWSEGQLFVEDVLIRDLLPEFRRFYDIPVTTDDPEILSKRVTATFRSMPSSEALEILQDMLGVNAVRQGGSVVLYPSPAIVHHGKN